MKSNDPINSVVNWFKKNTFGAERMGTFSSREVKTPDGDILNLVNMNRSAVGKRLGVTDPNDLTFGQKMKAIAMNDKGEYSAGRIAGMGAAGIFGLNAAGRIASGGGLYRDSDGNFDLIGIPFI